MKYWWSAFVRDYLNFGKRERNGIIIALLVVVTIYFVASRFFHPPKKPLNKQLLIEELAQLKITVDSSSRQYPSYTRNDDSYDYERPKRYGNYEVKGVLFEFDPNTIDEEGWRKLGVSEKTAQTIQHFLAKGYTFKKPEDIGKIYGLKPALANRLIPYVRIKSSATAKVASDNRSTALPVEKLIEKPVLTPVDVNLADTTDFIKLPGIGSKLASRIINFRTKLGGFATVDQVAETYGLPDSTFQLIKSRLKCDPANILKINVNTCDAPQLKKNPYISWNVANAVVRYRDQHGPYLSLNDLMKIEIIDAEMFKKLSPYLAVQ